MHSIAYELTADHWWQVHRYQTASSLKNITARTAVKIVVAFVSAPILFAMLMAKSPAAAYAGLPFAIVWTFYLLRYAWSNPLDHWLYCRRIGKLVGKVGPRTVTLYAEGLEVESDMVISQSSWAQIHGALWLNGMAVVAFANGQLLPMPQSAFASLQYAQDFVNAIGNRSTASFQADAKVDADVWPPAPKPYAAPHANLPATDLSATQSISHWQPLSLASSAQFERRMTYDAADLAALDRRVSGSLEYIWATAKEYCLTPILMAGSVIAIASGPKSDPNVADWLPALAGTSALWIFWTFTEIRKAREKLNERRFNRLREVHMATDFRQLLMETDTASALFNLFQTSKLEVAQRTLFIPITDRSAVMIPVRLFESAAAVDDFVRRIRAAQSPQPSPAQGASL